MTAAEATPPESEAAERIGRYEVICEIARGGMATVFLAHLGGLGGFRRLVAIKRLHPHLAHEPQFISMFLDEARLVAEIRHPNVVPTLDVSETAQGLCLVMEYIDGAPLTKLLKLAAGEKRGMNPRVAIRIMLDSLAGLHAAHELRDHEGIPLNLVHRDVSPHNLLVGSDGRTRLLDFGVARARQRLTTTRVGEMKGKLAYMAPEQASGQAIDRRTDLFAAGIVLWESLAGARLFYGSNEADTLSRLMTQEIPPLSQFSMNTPTALDKVVGRALDRDPDRRFSSAQDFANALEEAAAEYDLVGTYEEVAEAVEAAAGEMLQERRMRARDANASGINLKPMTPEMARAAVVTEQRSGHPATPTIPAVPAAKLDPPRGPSPSMLEFTNTGVASQAKAAAPRWRVPAAVAALLVVAGALVLALRGGAPSTEPASAQVAAEDRPATPETHAQPAATAGGVEPPTAEASAAEAAQPSEAAQPEPEGSAAGGADEDLTGADGAQAKQGWSLAQWKRWKAQQAWKARQSGKAAAKPTKAPAKSPGGNAPVADVDNPYR